MLDGAQAESLQILATGNGERKGFQILIATADGDFDVLLQPSDQRGEAWLCVLPGGLEKAEEAAHAFSGMSLAGKEFTEVQNRIRLLREGRGQGAEEAVDLFVRRLHAGKGA